MSFASPAVSSTSNGLSDPSSPADPGSFSQFAIRLDFFAGPMDLLLHLVHQQEVPIERVEMVKVAEQFLQIVSEARFLDLDRATEYLVIAATLLAIKSGAVLPASNGVSGESLDAEQGQQFYEELRERLRTYELTKQRAIELRKLPVLGRDTFVRRHKPDLPPPTEDEQVAQEDPHTIGVFFAKMLRRIGAGASFLKIRLEPISVVKYMVRIVDSLHDSLFGAVGDKSAGTKEWTFFGLLGKFAQQEQAGGPAARAEELATNAEQLGLQGTAAKQSRGVVIGSFVGILELVRRGVLVIAQSGEDQDITVGLRETSEEEVSSLASQLQAQAGQVRDGSVGSESLRVDEFLVAGVPDREPDNRKVVHMNEFRVERSSAEVAEPEEVLIKEVNS